ncbi:hypothetical protein [Phosphitispora sp. TUW77]|uniref:hypothetical protein n=1 Tax=Phosphitispora sp. TUW77 TaxID=3152361 RepID=UPI003AB5D1F6
MEIFWLIVFIGYIFFRFLGKKLPEMMEEFPGEWQFPGNNRQGTSEKETGWAGPAADKIPVTPRRARPKEAANAGNSSQESDYTGREGVLRETKQHREGVLPVADYPEAGPGEIDCQDVVNGFIMSELLQPPLARRKKR